VSDRVFVVVLVAVLAGVFLAGIVVDALVPGLKWILLGGL
jgi:hypothetical protein